MPSAQIGGVMESNGQLLIVNCQFIIYRLWVIITLRALRLSFTMPLRTLREKNKAEQVETAKSNYRQIISY